jgi:hypothetical protein
MEPEPFVFWAWSRFPNAVIDTQRHIVNDIKVSRKEFQVVFRWNNNLIIKLAPMHSTGDKFRGFPHRKTGFVLPLVTAFDLVWLQHVDHHIGVLIERNVLRNMVKETLQH